MKTLAVIKNESFADLLRFVSTSDLPSVLDNPDIPLPYTCLESVDNANADALLSEITTYFKHRQVKNKNFFALDSDSVAQLQFMFNLMKLSSGQPVSHTAHSTPSNQSNPIQPPVATDNVTITNNVVSSTKETEATADTLKTSITTTPVATEHSTTTTTTVTTKDTPNPFVSKQATIHKEVHNIATEKKPTNQLDDSTESEEFNPFESKETTEPALSLTTELAIDDAHTMTKQETHNLSDTIISLGVPKNAVINFVKDNNITALLVDEKTAIFADQTLTLAEAAKAAFKQSGTVGMAVGLGNWSYQGETLKVWKEKQMN